MNFQLAKIGHSFKGSMAYYLHDKRQEGEQQATTAERVAWSETRNLATDGPHTATRIMIATVQQADELKRAAGIKTTGRKATAGAVLAFSLQWRPDELPGRDRDEMTRAADHALKVLKLDHLQAVIVCHQDEPHPHVHVIVNRVDPETGKQTPIRAPDVQALDRWANHYEQERGQVVSPNRAKKYADQDRKRQEHPDPEKRRQYMKERNAAQKAKRLARQKAINEQRPTPAADLERVAARGGDRAADRQTPPPIDKTPAGMLKELGDAQKARHRQEWAQLAADHKRRRTAIYDTTGRHIRDQVAAAKEQARPLWSDLHRRQRTERKAFDAREQTLMGKVRNCIAAAKIQERRGEPSAHGFLSAAFAYVGARDARLQVFTAEQERTRTAFAADQKAGTDRRITAIKQVRGETLTQSGAIMAGERKALIERQNDERGKVREAWRQLNHQRGRTPARSQRENPTMPTPEEFLRAARLSPDLNKPKVQTVRQAVATPTPAPAPAGMPTPPARVVRDVLRVDQAAAWAKTEAGRAELAKQQPTPPARRAFTQATDKQPPAPTVQPDTRLRDMMARLAAEPKQGPAAPPARTPAPAQTQPPVPPVRQQFGEGARNGDMVRKGYVLAIPAGPPTPEQKADRDGRRARFAASYPGAVLGDLAEQERKAAPPPPPTQQARTDFWASRAQTKAAEMSRDQTRARGQDQDKDQEPKM